jgi:MFS family permease
MVVGLILTALGYLLLGPSKLLGLEPALWCSTLAMFVIGLAYSMAFIPTFESILLAVTDDGVSDDVTTYSLVSGLWSSFNSLGEVLGAGLGGLLMDFLDFRTGADIMVLWIVFTALVLGLNYAFELSCRPIEGKSDLKTSAEDLKEMKGDDRDSDLRLSPEDRRDIEEQLKRPLKKPSSSEKSLLINRSSDTSTPWHSFLVTI